MASLTANLTRSGLKHRRLADNRDPLRPKKQPLSKPEYPFLTANSTTPMFNAMYNHFKLQSEIASLKSFPEKLHLGLLLFT